MTKELKPRPWLSTLREEKELTIKALSEHTSCTASHLCDIEKGRKNPSLQQAFELAILLQFDVYKFYEGALTYENDGIKISTHEDDEPK